VPIGTLENNNLTGSTSADAMWLVPRRQMYQIDERFLRNEDFQIFLVDKGGVIEILPSTANVKVEISGNHSLSTEFHEEITSTHHQFFRTGRHIVTVEYSNKSAFYSLEVFSLNNGNSIGGDDGIGIIWLD
jgi:uncharacterized protein YkuJ